MGNSLSDFGMRTINQTGIETYVKHLFKQLLTGVLC